ncbi:hypothetical protein [Streptomyces sp. STCH 565 A]|uniref:hypothetical protein n=1 Tax=Streptomyces sp. STCH 565 A TaxID=2950532 RepID=UPI002075AF94|nr:hypothetical protein [Streptomyces sp. STCH 565 A]MCM8552647.1 hypothetical protein [Streptomyces sp. STCH 565 A]
MTTAHQNTHMAADTDLVRASLAYHYQDAPGLLSICSDADRWVGRRFTTDEVGIAAATRYVAELDTRTPKGIYAQVTTLREHPAKGRGGKDLAHALTWLWADGDYGHIGHKPGPDEMPHPADADHVREIVAASGLPQPSGWIDTGGGCNPVWTLTDTYLITDDDRAAIEEMTSALQAILGASAYHHGCAWDTQVGNLDRLMRVPGTINRKNNIDRPSTSYPGTGNPVDLDTMHKAITRLEPDARSTLEKAAAEKRIRQDERTGRTTTRPRPARATNSFPRATTGTGVFDILAAQLTFRDILEPEGWTYRGTAADGREKWLRPAGAEGSAESDYSLVCDNHVAVNWSERSGLPVGQQATGKKLTVPTLWAHLHYGGDEREATLDVLRAAFGQDATGAARNLPTPVLDEVHRRCTPPAAVRDNAPPDDMWGPDTHEPDAADAPDGEGEGEGEDTSTGRPGLIPDTFWNARPVFQHIRQAAHSQGCSGDTVLYSTLARLSAMVSHHIRAVTGIGGRASLNIFAAMVGTSGAGKSISAGCVRDLMHPADDDFRDGLPIGSGEGIAETFMGTVDEATGELHQKGPYKGDPVMAKVRKQVRHNAFFYVDEGQTMAKLSERTGSVLGETLRRAAIGEALGQTNASEERTRYIAPGSYSLGLLAGFQPSIATIVLADAHTGTPQRFFWGWADDPTIPDNPPAWPGPIEPHPGRIRPDAPVDIDFPVSIKQMLWRERVARGRGELEVSELDGHANLMKVKLAALFALLDQRTAVTEEDWTLAETVWTSSCKVRDSLMRRAQREAAAAKKQAEDAKVQAELRSHVAKKGADLTLERVAQLVLRHASQIGGVTYGALKKALASRDRPVAEKAVDLAVARGWVFEEGDRICVKAD